MMMTYRVLQLAAGLIHLDRFDLATPLSLNYFGGGFMMMLLFGYVLWAGLTRRLPVASESAPFAAREPWKPGKAFRWTFGIVALVYTVLGVAFLLLGKNAAPFWIDAAGMTPLTARLFSSPLIGLGLGLSSFRVRWTGVASSFRRSGWSTIGVTGTLAMIIERKDLVAANAIAVIVILTPVVLLTIGCVILLLRPKQYTRRGRESL